jgi:anaphase-promoting complex subunit 7
MGSQTISCIGCFFLQARLIDPNIMTYMDEYAILLKTKSDYIKLNKLVHDMLHIDPARPETCVALAAMWERKDERKALTYAEKVHTF